MGCNFNFGEPPEECINGKVDEQINQAKNDANRKIDDANNKARAAPRLTIEHYNVSVRELAEVSSRPW